ncbi:MAG: DeoR/GlpR family DNA-binding transcription regulator [Eubacterium sp.]
MYSIERKVEIIKMLERNHKVEVNALAEYFDTSKETIRRDLKTLEKEGILERTHGGAVSAHLKSQKNESDFLEYPLAIRGIQNYKEKQKICQLAVSFIQNGDTVFVDNSSTTMYLAQFLPRELQVTFITNSIKFLTEASQYDCTNKVFICLGGMYNPKNLSTYDNSPVVSGAEYFPDKCFISCAGISSDRMCTDTSIYEVHTKQRMIEASKEVFLLADHTKFESNGQFFLTDFGNIHHIITDNETRVDELPFLQNKDIILAEKD